MIRILIATLLLCSVAAGQSISVSGGRSSFIISGKGTPQKVAEKPQDDFVPVPAENPVVSVPVKPQPVPVVQAKRQWYLVSEAWCSHCPAAKRAFRAKGWPEKNILTIAQCEQRFGFRPSHVPFEFGEPDGTANTTTSIVSRSNSFQTQGRYYNYGGRQYDLENYGGCSMRSCGMCAEIRAAAQRYRESRQLINKVEVGPQAASPEDVIEEALQLLDLKPDSVFCDLGCGNASVLIKAVQRSGCRAIGVEIDPAKVAEARRMILDHGLSSQVTILQGDVRDFSPARHSVTHIYAYLYPELLQEISGTLESVGTVVCPGHECTGIGMKLIGQCWVRKAVKSDYQLTSQPIARVQQSGCSGGKCSRSQNRRRSR